MASFFLCYECGTTFNAKNDFDEHILIHQAVSLCYQIYEFDKGGPTIAKAKVENQHVSSSKECQKPQAVKLSGTLRRAPSDQSHKNARKTTAKRKSTDVALSSDSLSKVPCLKQRKMSQNDVKITKINKAQGCPTINAAAISHTSNPQMDKESLKVGLDEPKYLRETSSVNTLITMPLADVSGATQIELVGNQMMNATKVVERSKTDVSIATATTSTGLTTSSLPSTTASTKTPKQEGHITSATAATLPKCLNCDYRSSQGTDMVEHVVRVHKTSITSLERVDFVNGKWSKAVKLEPRQQCPYCVRTFREVTDYYLHVIIYHKRNLLSPGVSKYNCIVYLAHPGMPTHVVRIFMKRP